MTIALEVYKIGLRNYIIASCIYENVLHYIGNDFALLYRNPQHSF